jgi:transcriptional regulator with XRE-family HTH domain
MKDVRDGLGITQEQLANYLGITRSQLSLVELDKRFMPTSASVKGSKLLLAMLGKKKMEKLVAEIARQTKTLNKKLQERSKECTYLAAVASRKLQAMQQQYNQCCNALQAVQNLLPNLPATKEFKGDRLWLEILEMDALTKLAHCGPDAQTHLQLQIDLLEYEAEQSLKKLK